MMIDAVLSGERRWVVQCGDALDVLKTMPDECVDAVVTDPPYFLVNDSGNGFMGKAWDSLSVGNVVAVAFFKSMKLDLSMAGESSAAECASTSTKTLPTSCPSCVPCAEPTSADVEVALNDSAHRLVITRPEALALCKELCPDLTGYLQKLPTGARLVAPTSFLECGSSAIVKLIAYILHAEPAWSAPSTTSTETASGNPESHPTEAKSGNGSAEKSTQETTGNAGGAGSSVGEGTFNVTMSSRGASRETIRRITSLRSVRDATRRFTSSPNAMGVISEWWHWRWAMEVMRVLKPGGHVLAFGGSRTSHALATGIANAGFELRETLMWVHGQGFPKSRNVSKAIDAKLGATRKVIGQRTLTGNAALTTKEKGGTYASATDAIGVPGKVVDITAPGSPEAEKWDGWGTALKPAYEPIVMARKPFKGTVEACVLANGCGAINVDGCRVAGPSWSFQHTEKTSRSGGILGHASSARSELQSSHELGRWPAHLLFSHAPGCKRIGERKVKAAPPWNDNRSPSPFTGAETSPVHHSDQDGTETVEAYECVEGCPIRELDEQSGLLHNGGQNHTSDRVSISVAHNRYAKRAPTKFAGDYGAASRYFTQFPAAPFFYQAKPSRAERERGCECMDEETVDDGRDKAIDNPYQRGKTPRRNTHATVKSIELMRWLCRLATQTEGLVLDPFCGSGSTGVAALAEGFRFIGIELEEKHCSIARARIEGDMPLFNRTGER